MLSSVFVHIERFLGRNSTVVTGISQKLLFLMLFPTRFPFILILPLPYRKVTGNACTPNEDSFFISISSAGGLFCRSQEQEDTKNCFPVRTTEKENPPSGRMAGTGKGICLTEFTVLCYSERKTYPLSASGKLIDGSLPTLGKRNSRLFERQGGYFAYVHLWRWPGGG